MDDQHQQTSDGSGGSKPLPVRLIVVATLLAVIAGAALVLAERSTHRHAQTTSAAQRAVSPAKPVSVRMSSRLPAWLAPGAQLTVVGWTRGGVRVGLILNGRRVAVATAGPGGRFVLVGRVRDAGRVAVSVRAGGRAFSAGMLLVRPIRLAAVGDVTPGEGVSAAASSTVAAAAYPWAGVSKLLRSADLATANLEGAIARTGKPVPDKQYHFRGSTRFLRGAATAGGLDVVTVANNHSLDFGKPGLLATLAAVHAVHLRSIGGGANLARARQPVVVTVGGLRVALLGYTDIRPAGFDAGPTSAGAAPAEPSYVSADVARARKHADVVVVWFHWGVQSADKPDARQVLLARTALQAGASLVLGAHPHVLQPLKRSPHSLVAWSLGNFENKPTKLSKNWRMKTDAIHV